MSDQQWILSAALFFAGIPVGQVLVLIWLATRERYR